MRIQLLSFVAIGVVSFSMPASGQRASTMCKDGSPSTSSGRGACSGHGGVDAARTRAAAKAVKAEAKEVVQAAKTTGTMVQCGDGTMSDAGRGACSHHKGVRISQLPTAASPSAATPAAPATPAMSPSRPARAMPATPAMPAASAMRPTAAARPMPSAQAKSSMPAAPVSAASHRAEDNDPTGAIAQCRDGMYSHAANHRGACSRHKGVGTWLKS